jgi:lipopolysaccharide transport protein LptA
MKRLTLIIAMTLLGGCLFAQTPPPKSAKSPSVKKPDEKTKPEDKAPRNQLLGPDTKSNEPITTEIYADQAFFDSSKSMGIFTGHVKVTDPRFNLQSDKLTVFISKGENQGLERAIAEGNVGLVRDRPDPNGGPPTRAVGRSEKANYVASTGDVELTGTPRVQQGLNTHVATSPDTVMVINQAGQLTTHGPSRTDIRQEPKDDEDQNKGDGNAKPEDKDKKKSDEQKKSKPANKPKS